MQTIKLNTNQTNRIMKRLMNYAIILALVPTLLFTSCKKDPPPIVETDHYAVMTSYMAANGLDLSDMIASGWVIAASAVVDADNGFTVPGYHVFDIRGAADYEAGHIPGAINVTLGNIVSSASSYTDKPILVVCYTGQTAGHAVVALRLSGYANATVLKWGMAGWNPAFEGPWAANSGHDNGNIAVGSSNWVTSASPSVGSFDTPTWTASAEDGASILAERVAAMISGSFKGIGAQVALDDHANYQIFNYWPEADYTSIGHINGAFQYQTMTIASGGLSAVNPDAASAVYCYTGQTSSMITAWLNVLGYNATSIKFGVNALNYDGLYNANKTTYHGAENYGYQTGEGQTIVNSYSTLKEYMVANNLDLPDVLNGWTIPASTLATALTSNYVFDIRSADSYNAGHIEGAINVALEDVVSTAASYSDKPIIVACYTGQTAAHAAMALRLSGYPDAKVLLWGMSGWNSTLSGSWNSNIGSTGVGHANWVKTATPATSTYAAPSFTTTATDGAGILAERVALMLEGGLVGVTTKSILADPSVYQNQIFNYWGETDYLGYGHFSGAFQYNTISLADDKVAAIDPSNPSIIYCYTGQTSSMITAWLNVLGYDALSGKFGAGGVIYDAMSGHKFITPTTDLPLVTN